ncbi:MAG: class A beta-lactamase-related serine hydrolase [Clostridiales bacterium]|nr:class A beta-lactamase-related serine hydrolase [Clostridiales bacterium]MCC8105811.1 class A beta-lactamase-related serine hydrolase [Clostridiales bacterium]
MSDEWNRLNRQIERERKVRRTRLYIGIVIAAILLFVIGISMIIQRLSSYDSGIEEALGIGTAETETESETESETETETETEFTYGDIEELEVLIEDTLADHSGIWSVYVKDLDSGNSISINNESMYAASLIKLFVMQSCYENMDDLIANYCSINNAGEETAAATIEDRLYTMIVYSRNESYNELVRLHSSTGSFTSGCRLVNSYIAGNGYLETGVYTTLHPSDSSFESTGEGTNHTTVEDCGALLESIYNGTCVSEEASEAMLDLLLQQDVTTKIPAGVPDGISVANKTGDTDEESHDVAIVYGEKTNYILCVMSSEVDEMGAGNAGTLIKEISTLVYDFLN